MTIFPHIEVGCARRWEVINRLGSVSDGGLERRNVVEVPRERIASPGLERETRVAGLSPVNGPIIHSIH